jgi:hypothetical protein
VNLTTAWAHFSAERFEEAAECARPAIDWNPAFADAHGVLAAASPISDGWRTRAPVFTHLPASFLGTWPTVMRCPFLAQSGHPTIARKCPLLGEERTSIASIPMSAFDPKQTSGGPDLRVACLFMDNRCLRAFAH